MSILSDCRLDFRFFNRRCADWLAFFDKTQFAMRWETRSGWNQVAHDHVLFEAAEPIDFAERRRFG